MIVLVIEKNSGSTTVSGLVLTQACRAQSLHLILKDLALSKKLEDFHFENFFAHNLTPKKQLPAFAWGFKKACHFAESVVENKNQKFF